MGLADDLLDRHAALAAERVHWERVWQDVVALAMPHASRQFSETLGTSQTGAGFAPGPDAARRSRELFDSTAAVALDRLTAAMESMVTPRAVRWHGLARDERLGAGPDFLAGDHDQDISGQLEDEWFDNLADYLFAVRYDSRSGFAMANQKAIRSACGLGTGIVYVEENLGYRGLDVEAVPILYRALPVAECYLGADLFGMVDQCFRLHDVSARSAASYFGAGNMSAKVRDMAGDEKRKDSKIRVLQAVMPRTDAGESLTGSMQFASYWLEVDGRHLISRSGFAEFPFVVYHWDQSDGSPYGQSPIMAVLADLKMLQVMNRHAVQAAQQMIKPPMATMAGIYARRLDLNPGKTNPGYLGEDGRLKVQPLITAQNPRLAEGLIEAKRDSIRESLYSNLFRTLTDTPQISATEAMIRQSEKAELMGPAGTRIQAALARLVERELAILERRGAFLPASPLAPPASLNGSALQVRFTSPLDRQRRIADIQGVQATLEIADRLAAVDPAVTDRIDTDESLSIARSTFDAPRRMLRDEDEVAAIRLLRHAAADPAGGPTAEIDTALPDGDGTEGLIP